MPLRGGRSGRRVLGLGRHRLRARHVAADCLLGGDARGRPAVVPRHAVDLYARRRGTTAGSRTGSGSAHGCVEAHASIIIIFIIVLVHT